MPIERAVGLLLLAVGLAACSGGGASGETGASTSGAFRFPTATIEFTEKAEAPTSAETVVEVGQQQCVEARRASGQAVTVKLVTAAELAQIPSRTARAYYDGAYMAWYERRTNYFVDPDSCEVQFEHSLSASVVTPKGARQWNKSDDGTSDTVDMVVTPADASRSLFDGGTTPAELRKIQGQSCVRDPALPQGLASLGAESCHWRDHPEIRDGALEFVPLYRKMPDPINPDGGARIWQATSIRIGEKPPASAFELPQGSAEPAADLFTGGK
jgi:hypothetical protein